MRVRYKFVGNIGYTARCDLSQDEVRKLFENLKTNGRCLWGELVGEDDDNFMQILDSFDNSKIAKVYSELFEI